MIHTPTHSLNLRQHLNLVNAPALDDKFIGLSISHHLCPETWGGGGGGGGWGRVTVVNSKLIS